MKIVSKGVEVEIGPNGATFTPAVSEGGDLSWTNNAGLENPPTVNVKGPPGAPGVTSRPNLLDNWYFPRPINQREVSGTISTSGYFIDRWMLLTGTVEITEAGLVLNGTICQRLEHPTDGHVTATALTTSGIRTASYIPNAKQFRITLKGETLIAAKLEYGTEQTLADENGNLLDPAPNETLELLKCQRYLYVLRLGSYTPICIGHLYASYRIDCPFVFPVPLYNEPTVTVYGTFFLQYNSTFKESGVGSGKNITAVSFTRFDKSRQRCTCMINIDTSFLSGVALGTAVIFESSGLSTNYIMFSSEL